MKSIVLFFLTAMLVGSAASGQETKGLITATLNGLTFTFDGENGSIVGLSHPATGNIIRTTKDSGGLVEIALPVTEFEPLRLAPRFSKNASIQKTDSSVIIHWDELGASRSFAKFQGKVGATITITEDADGESVNMSCTINNNSDHEIPQVIFPDLSAILPFCGTTKTEFRTGGIAIKPFVDMIPPEHDNFYVINESQRWFHYGFVLDGKNLVIKWVDIGGRKGGLSMFSKDWGENGGYDEGVYLKLSERTKTLRYLKTIFKKIAPKGSWQSAEIKLTPHANGWARGIVPYRNWAEQHINRLFPVPDHVRDGLGYQTLWMRNFFYPEDPEGNNFTYKDLPKVAKDAKAHGLDEMVIWGWNDAFTLPLPPSNKFVGTVAVLVDAVAECKKIGVNLSPFRSVMIANTGTSKKYGVPTGTTEYNYDPEFLPMLNPVYAIAGKGAAMIPSSNKLWQEEALTSTVKLIEMGVPSIAWDQFFQVGPGRSFDTLMTKIVTASKHKDPNATISGEAGTNMENECNFLDYTWNWDYKDGANYSALLNSLKKGPRINVNIDKSVEETKIGFADNLYLNIYPRKADGVNGSDYISNHPELSNTLKQCARLRKQFLKYFVDGTYIADCLLEEEVRDTHVSAYTMGKKLFVILINRKNRKEISLPFDLKPWLPSGTGKYTVKMYNGDGKMIKTKTVVNGKWKESVGIMDKLDMRFFEINAD